MRRKIPSRPFPKRHEPTVSREDRAMARAKRIAKQRPGPTLHKATTAKPAFIAAVPKTQRLSENTKEAREHKDALAQLGCMVCRRLFPHLAPGPVELHHLRGGGWGRGDYTTLIPLCVEHHRGDTGVHGLGTKGFEKHYGFSQADLLMDALTLKGRP